MKRFIVLAVAAACLAGIACPDTFAAGGAGSSVGYALSAVGFRSYFVFATRPGHAVSGALRVVNLDARTRTIILTPVDVSTAAAGGLQYGNVSPSQEGRWLTLARDRVRLSSHSTTSVSFTVRVPPDAQPGDHFVGIIAVDRRVLHQRVVARGPVRLRLIPRLAMTVQLRLPGISTRQLKLGSIGIAVAPSGASLAFALSNPARKLIPSTTGSATISQNGTPLFSRSIDLAAFVPKTTITYHVPWEGTPVEGTYRVTGKLQPAGAPLITFDRTVTFARNAIHQYRQQTGRAAKESPGPPVVLVLALAAAVAVAATFAIAYARTRKLLRDRS